MVSPHRLAASGPSLAPAGVAAEPDRSKRPEHGGLRPAARRGSGAFCLHASVRAGLKVTARWPDRWRHFQ
jgi:hypothetical protein